MNDVNIFWGLSRSGIHAVLFWIIGQLEDKEINPEPFWNVIYRLSDRKFFRYTPPKNADHSKPERSGGFLSPIHYGSDLQFSKSVFHNAENRLLKGFITSKLTDKIDIFLNENQTFLSYKKIKPVLTDSHTNILLLRDPFNYIASSYRHFKNKKFKYKLFAPTNKKRFVFSKSEFSRKLITNKWKSHAKEFLGKTNYLDNKVYINYNKWAIDIRYREGLCEIMGIPFSDKNKETVFPFGFGSSFDVDKYIYNASNMKVLERWKVFKDDEFYRSFFHDKELIDLSNEIYGDIEGTEILYR